MNNDFQGDLFMDIGHLMQGIGFGIGAIFGLGVLNWIRLGDDGAKSSRAIIRARTRQWRARLTSASSSRRAGRLLAKEGEPPQ